MIDLPFAHYIDAEIEEYQGHPLINALPAINAPEDTAGLLNRYPKISEVEKSLPGHIRRHAMMRILDQFLYPTKSHLQLEQMISSMLRRGYLSRNIAKADYQLNLESAARTDFKAIARNAGNEALVSSVIGCSGTGKSTAVEAILQGYPQAIYHPEYQHTQLVWLKVESPHDGSVKNLCTNFFRAIDTALGTDYLKLYVKARSSAESMLGDIAHVAALHSIGILVIDEIQHLEKSRLGGTSKILNFFVTLTNVIKVPVLFIGTPKALELFNPTMRSARRAAQFGSLNWNRFNHVEGCSSDTEWLRFINRMWKLQWLKTPTPLSRPLAERFWDLTQGIAHIAVTLFYLCQVRAVMTRREVITPGLVKQVFDDELSMVSPMIEALKLGRKKLIEQYGDLDIPIESIRLLAVSADEEVTPVDPVAPNNPDESLLEELTRILTGLGLGEEIALMTAQQAIDEKPDEDIFGLIAHVKQLQEKPLVSSKDKKPKVEPVTPNYMKGDIRQLHDSAPQVSYQNLKKAGVVIDLTSHLMGQ